MLPDTQALVANFVRDDAGRLTPTDIDLAVQAALERYSQDSPVETAEDLAGVSGTLISLPAGWQEDFSDLKSLECPVGRVPPTYIANDAYSLYRDVGGLKIMLLVGLASGSTVRATYTVRHTLTALKDTTQPRHREALAKLAAASLCDQLAAFYANDTDSTIAADRAQGQTKSQAYAARAREYRKQYQDTLGVVDKTALPASAVATLHPKDSYGQPFVFHPPWGSTRR